MGIRENGMCRARSMNGWERSVQCVLGTAGGRGPLGRARRRCEDNTELDLPELR